MNLKAAVQTIWNEGLSEEGNSTDPKAKGNNFPPANHVSNGDQECTGGEFHNACNGHVNEGVHSKNWGPKGETEEQHGAHHIAHTHHHSHKPHLGGPKMDAVMYVG